MLHLVFSVAAQRYALECGNVVEVIPSVPLRDIPHAPASVAGVFQYRGRIVPTIDLCQLLWDRPCEQRFSTRIVLVHYNAKKEGSDILGLMAERMVETVSLSPSEEMKPGVQTNQAPYLGPIYPDEDGMIQTIHIERLLPETLKKTLFQSAAEWDISDE